MVDVRGDVLRPPHGTTPAAVKAVQIVKRVAENFLKVSLSFQSSRSNQIVQPECTALVFDQPETGLCCRKRQLRCLHCWILVHIPEW